MRRPRSMHRRSERGDGGKVVLWADDRLTLAGTILALGGKKFGNGGFVETSEKPVNLSGNDEWGRGARCFLIRPTTIPIGRPYGR